MSIAAWNSRRSDFNHRWLANEYLQQLRCWVQMLGGRQHSKPHPFSLYFINNVLRQWESAAPEARDLLRTAVDELSPRRLFILEPLNRIPADIAIEMATICHDLWLARTVEYRTSLEKAIEQADVVYNQLVASLDASTASDVDLKKLAEALLASCEHVRKLFELLPTMSSQ